jgi:hypothetical protein
VAVAVDIIRARFIGRHTGVAILHSEIISRCNFNRLIVGICSIKLSITCWIFWISLDGNGNGNYKKRFFGELSNSIPFQKIIKLQRG